MGHTFITTTARGPTGVTHRGAAGVTVDGAPSGPDVMRVTSGGAGVSGVEVIAYFKDDYDAGVTTPGARRGSTTTGGDGRWVSPLFLLPGTYVVVASKAGYLVRTLTVVVPA